MSKGLTNRLKRELHERYDDLIPVGKEVMTFHAGAIRTGRIVGLAPMVTLRMGDPYVKVVFDELSPLSRVKYIPLRVVTEEDESYVAPFQRSVSPEVRQRLRRLLRDMEVRPWEEGYKEAFEDFEEEVE